MGVETREKTIDGHKYKLTLFGARQGQRVLLRLTKFLGPAVAVMVAARARVAGTEEANQDQALEAMITGAIQAFVGGLNEADLDYLIDQFAAKCELVLTLTTAAGEKPAPMALADLYDAHFSRRYAASLKWLAWAVQENFGDFFEGTGIDAFGSLAQGLFKSESPQALNGSSGES